jgi:hypothetical protein
MHQHVKMNETYYYASGLLFMVNKIHNLKHLLQQRVPNKIEALSPVVRAH